MEKEVIDHVNRVIRGYETIGTIVRVKGSESLLRDGGDILKFIFSVSATKAAPGAVADGGWIEMGLGLSESAQQATTAGQKQTSSIASELMKSEENTISIVREKYDIELKPW